MKAALAEPPRPFFAGFFAAAFLAGFFAAGFFAFAFAMRMIPLTIAAGAPARLPVEGWQHARIISLLQAETEML